MVSFGALLPFREGVPCEVMPEESSVFVEMADRLRGEKMRTSPEASPASRSKRGGRIGKESEAFNVGFMGCEVIDTSPY